MCGLTAEPDAYEQYLRDALFSALDSSDLHLARQTLERLRIRHPDRYEEQGFAATAAWLEARAGNWHGALLHHDQHSPDAKDPQLILDIASCHFHLGHLKKALAVLDGLPNRLRESSLEVERSELQAQACMALGDLRGAEIAWRRLLSHRVPARTLLEAHLHLVEVYYQRNQKPKARHIAGELQSRWPGSDEALRSVELQRDLESPAYLRTPERLHRHGWVFYRNREYDRSDQMFSEIIQKSARPFVDRARYFLALTHLKRESPMTAVDAFERAFPLLQGTRYEGPAAFQTCRALLMIGRDQEVVEFAERYYEQGHDDKWRQECVKLQILGLRRLGRIGAFGTLGAKLTRDRVKPWLMEFYHRHGLAWSLQDFSPQVAQTHLEAYRDLQGNLGFEAETRLWEGLIFWEQGLCMEALDIWLDLARDDPNHFFGLVARQLTLHLPQSEEKIRGIQEAVGPLQQASTESLRSLFALMPRGEARNHIGALLAERVAWPDLNPGVHLVNSDSKASPWARIGRLDIAADLLRARDVAADRATYHLLKAKWYRTSGRPRSSIAHAEYLADGIPDWVPLEIYPRAIQTLYYPRAWSEFVYPFADERQLDPLFLFAIIREESRFDERAKSVASARGLMQFIPSTAERTAQSLYGDEPFEPRQLYRAETAIALGAAYVDHLLDTFGGISIFSVAAYNAGEDAVQRWRSFSDSFDPLQFVWDITYTETRSYCQKVLGSYRHYHEIYGKETDLSGPSRIPARPYLQMLERFSATHPCKVISESTVNRDGPP